MKSFSQKALTVTLIFSPLDSNDLTLLEVIDVRISRNTTWINVVGKLNLVANVRC